MFERLWNADIPSSLIALEDLAEAAATVLIEREKHYFAQYPLCSTLPTSDAEVVEVIEKVIGKKVQTYTPTFEQGVENTLKFLFGSGSDLRAQAAEGDLRPDITRDEAERLVLFYNRRGLRGNPTVLRWLIQREPITVEDWVKSQMA